MITIYKTIIQSHIDYCITIWVYATKCQIQRVERLQNKIYTLITGDYSWNTSPMDILSQLNIPSVSQRLNNFNGINVYSCLNGSFPTYMSYMLSYDMDINSRVTRHSTNNNLYVPRPRVEIYRQTFQHTGPIIYNYIPQDLKKCAIIVMFQSQFKKSYYFLILHPHLIVYVCS